jgi:hypothetical protein
MSGPLNARLRPAVLGLAMLAPSSAKGCDAFWDALDLPRPDLGPLGSSEPEPESPGPASSASGKVGKTTPAVPKGVVDLGIAFYPKDNAKQAPAEIQFTASTLNPSKYAVGYRLQPDEAQAVTDYYAKLAKSVGYEKLEKDRFRWVPPKGCPSDMSCIYKRLIERTGNDVAAITDRFKARIKAQKLGTLQATQLALAYVQYIPYKLPTDPFGLKPSPLVASQREGDCDSKSLLLWMILKSIGVDAVIVSSQAHAHTMVGVALPVSGTTFTHQGRKYAFVETTAEGAPLGHLNPTMKSPNDWRVELDGN